MALNLAMYANCKYVRQSLRYMYRLLLNFACHRSMCSIIFELVLLESMVVLANYIDSSNSTRCSPSCITAKSQGIRFLLCIGKFKSLCLPACSGKTENYFLPGPHVSICRYWMLHQLEFVFEKHRQVQTMPKFSSIFDALYRKILRIRSIVRSWNWEDMMQTNKQIVYSHRTRYSHCRAGTFLRRVHHALHQGVCNIKYCWLQGCRYTLRVS